MNDENLSSDRPKIEVAGAIVMALVTLLLLASLHFLSPSLILRFAL